MLEVLVMRVNFRMHCKVICYLVNWRSSVGKEMRCLVNPSITSLSVSIYYVCSLNIYLYLYMYPCLIDR